MPSPVGHVLGGIASGLLVSREPGHRALVLFAVAGAAADLDLILPVQHRGASHSLGAALLVLAVATGWQWLVGSRMNSRLTWGLAAAYGSHVLLDWLGADGATPRGIMALWPFSHAFYISRLDLFLSVDRRYWLPGFWWVTTMALARELLVLAPIAWLSSRFTVQRFRSTGRTPDRSCGPAGPRRPSA
jgi:membrane-bound metal-dependent hydrolase YbcI (DUF457 family)